MVCPIWKSLLVMSMIGLDLGGPGSLQMSEETLGTTSTTSSPLTATAWKYKAALVCDVLVWSVAVAVADHHDVLFVGARCGHTDVVRSPGDTDTLSQSVDCEQPSQLAPPGGTRGS